MGRGEPDSQLVCVQLSSLNNLTIYGPKPSRGRAALCSFNVKGLHATDISTLLDQEGRPPRHSLAALVQFCHALHRLQVLLSLMLISLVSARQLLCKQALMSPAA